MKLKFKPQVFPISTDDSDKADSASRFYADKLKYETDPADVYADIQHGVDNFFLLDVRSQADYQRKHIAGAISLPHSRISEQRLAQFPDEAHFVVYCWGPGCNGSTKAALKLAQLGYAVKEMIGGIEYWEREGHPIAQDEDALQPLLS